MDIYILNEDFEKIEIVDDYKSFIWTERYNTLGDFELLTDPSTKNRSTFKDGRLITIKHSKRVMIVEEILDSYDDQGEATLKISGRSFESIMKSRIAKRIGTDVPAGNTPYDRELEYEGKPAKLARDVFHYSVIFKSGTNKDNKAITNQDHIPNIGENNIYPPDNLPEYDETIKVEFNNKDLYEVIRELTKSYRLGFRMVRCPDCYEVKFNVFAGSDRSEQIKFSSDLENFDSPSSYRNSKDYRNVAYVASNKGKEVVYAYGIPEDVSGLDRKVLFVDVGDYDDDDTTTDFSEDMALKGWQALLEHNREHAVDGEVPPDTGYIYDDDYYLGDLVQAVGPDGMTDKMRVTEYIFISDPEGFRSYPTLTQEEDVTEGTWISAEWRIPWEDAEPEWRDT